MSADELKSELLVRRLVLPPLIGAALLLCSGVLPSSAHAAPVLKIETSRDIDVLPVVHRGDQRVDYDVVVSNTASASSLPTSGETLSCVPSSTGGVTPTYSYAWRRNGELIVGQSGTTYTVAPADAGAVIQCEVRATNAVPDVNSGGFSATSGTSEVGLVIEPPPVSSPPVAPSGIAGVPAPTPANPVAGTVMTCATGTWTGVSQPFEFEWYVNGIAIPGATEATYTLQAADVPGEIQCAVIGSNGETAMAKLSQRRPTSPAPSPRAPANVLPTLSGGNTTMGAITVEIDLPVGAAVERFYVPSDSLQTPTMTPNGWSCAAVAAAAGEPAKAICERSDALGPESSYPPFSVAIGLSSAVPDTAVTVASVSGGSAPEGASATGEFIFAPAKLFGVEAFETVLEDEAGQAFRKAGGHPFMAGAAFSFTRYRELHPEVPNASNFRLVGRPKVVRVETPRGFVGNAQAIEELCPSAQRVLENTCPEASAVGGMFLRVEEGGLFGDLKPVPIYAIEPEAGRPAQFAFFDSLVKGVYTFFPKLRAEDGYAITLESAPLPASFPSITDIKAELCGFGAATESAPGQELFVGCKTASDPTSTAKPLVTLPTRCTATPPTTRLSLDSWESPGSFVSASWTDPPLEGCGAVPFDPAMELTPLSQQADSPTGMDVEIAMPTDGLESKMGISQAHLKQVTVTLPQGMALNASAAHGLGACSAAQIGIDPVTGVPNEEEPKCPQSSKIGTVGVTTPLIKTKLAGDVYVASQGADNPFDSNIAMYMVFSSKRDGITVKVAGEVKPDPNTGQMQIVFDDNPEAPFSSVELHFPQGPRAALLNPPRCGNYEIRAQMVPWSAPGEVVEAVSPFSVSEGPNGGPCPTESLDPKLEAGSTNPIAGKTSPFVMRLHREDGTQRFRGLEISPPLGLTAYLKGVPYCSDAALASISGAAETARAQIASPSCPAASQIGSAQAGAGGGANPYYVDAGKVYLAGPYMGAPISLAVVTPAVAGPFDLGSVVIRTALYVNPVTAQIRAVSDPIPTILHGILLDIRDVRVTLDRPGFILNPTSCAEKTISATVQGVKGLSANEPGDSVTVSNRFQVGECGTLGFKPNVNLRLKGGTKRDRYQQLTATVTARPGDANIARASVNFPPSIFLAQEHIRTVCTRVQFAADNCPKASVYGHAEAITPLLDYPLSGPVYLRSSNNLLPDLVAVLQGPAHQPIEIELSGRTDSKNKGLRNTFDVVPDAPVTKFTLRMQGGKKSLLVSSRNLCAGKQRARVQFDGQNGKKRNYRPKIQIVNCKKGKAPKRKGSKGKRR